MTFTASDVQWLKEAVVTIERDGYPKVSQMLREEINKLECQKQRDILTSQLKRVPKFRGKPL